MRKKVLFFGVTGIEKCEVMRRLAGWAERHRARNPVTVVDFDDEHLFNPQRGGEEWYTYLDSQQPAQRRIWRRCWHSFAKSLEADSQSDLFVGLHGGIVRGHYGVRCNIDPESVARDLRPDLIVTLLDDVYDMWWRTERRADNDPWVGRPTLEQLLFARRAELLFADQVANSVDPPIPHFTVSVSHPCETVANRIYSNHSTVVYLCFPISAPRDLVRESNDNSGIEEVARFLRQAYATQHRNPDLIFVCPLGIDELPLLAALRHDAVDPNGAQGVEFDREVLRWSMDAIWPPESRLTPGPPNYADRIPFPRDQVEAAAGIIETDVGWRDYRLVEQARSGCLAAFNPKFRNREDISRSVFEEIRFAAGSCPVFVFEDPTHDPDRVFERHYPQGGTMPPGPASQMVARKPSLEALFAAVEELARRKAR